MAKQGASKDSKTYAIATAKAKKLAEAEGDTSMDDILDAFQAALAIEDDAKADQALKAVYNALKDKVKGKLGQAADYAKDKLTKYADNLEEVKSRESQEDTKEEGVSQEKDGTWTLKYSAINHDTKKRENLTKKGFKSEQAAKNFMNMFN